ncbi:MAG: lantibiotic modifying-like protein [Thermomicrobia bacterium]|nr:lantibiotic modifying-like protein [Thermomicrobia bacterium]
MWDGGVTSVSYLEAAGDAARWIRSTARAADHGLVWLPDPDRPERSATITAPATIYSGNAGIVLFFLELAEATGDASYLDDARRGADQIAATWREVLTFPSLIPVDNVNLAFNMGLSGTAFVLAQVWRATRDATYRDAAFAITTQIADAARPVGAGVEWVGAASAGLGDGSIILFLAEPDPRGGLRWAGFPMERLGMAADIYMPNFEFGTAGVAYVLARLFEATGDARFLHAAREGAAHVQAIATVRGDAALLAYREPDMADLFYLGYCHGPVGTARTFYALSRITGEPAYAEWLGRFARGVMTTGIPEKQTPGLWNVVCQCCGTAGIADFFVSLWIATREPEYLTFAKRVADATLSRATDFDGQGNRWYQAWTRTKPWEVTAETGYMIGAAGVGSALLHLHLAEGGKYRAILFPDNPFPRGMGEPQ